MQMKQCALGVLCTQPRHCAKHNIAEACNSISAIKNTLRKLFTSLILNFRSSIKEKIISASTNQLFKERLNKFYASFHIRKKQRKYQRKQWIVQTEIINSFHVIWAIKHDTYKLKYCGHVCTKWSKKVADFRHHNYSSSLVKSSND